MGQIMTKLKGLFPQLFGNREVKMIMIGLDNAGKTTILYKLKLNEDIMTIPTIGFNVETIEYNRLIMNVWDVGGQTKIRKLWGHYYVNTDAVIYVVDSCDRERIHEARDELHNVMSDYRLRDASLLIFANKQDLPGAMKAGEVADLLDLSQFKNRKWFVQPSCAKTGEGLYEGLDWVSNNLPTKLASEA